MKRKAEVRMDIEQIKGEIRHRMTEISSLLKEGNNKDATQAFINFGAFLQDQYPDLLLDDLRKKMEGLMGQEFFENEMPPLGFIQYYINGRQEVYEDILEEEVTNELKANRISKMDAAIKGVNIFSHLLGGMRWEEGLKASEKEHPFDESILEEAKQWLVDAPYQVSKNVSEAARQKRLALHFVSEIRDNLEITIKSLSKQILEEVDKNPDLYNSIFKEGDRENNIDSLVKHLKENPSDAHSTEIKMAAASYDALKALTHTLDDAGKGNPRPQDKLRRFEDHLNNESVRSALDTNPDDDVTQFFKTVLYILKCAVTLTAYHWVTEGESLRSTQQQSLKDALTTLKKADEEGVIDPPTNTM
ncbi:hypothetical protein [Legionella parisiensis]|uniref:Uncharacterized protein n=1 Tax=Legionella parisiensis TaxID=45071 RepID=A0A1E5JPG1_9GAMM|nr:hypothetical protein [Legionella parisiensis]KTD44326.1 hypothetical protein Lpar_0412 [Legionella parisiensis]OEH45918.1 hypothetical protein lpari_03106 [Legionella parisiensis]STX71952.1 Uncharacterised protein [Legionella parisiensis]